ncbi:hypothetical protein [Bradyrhizobium liaoningense]|uniref:hypothetical protein n=1 Tax=Bradyrhizobium liaoningense TaxID=43992 RepID=UPI0020118C05|nr:hypothetical protein [Bradyrhizobium liaoningense]
MLLLSRICIIRTAARPPKPIPRSDHSLWAPTSGGRELPRIDGDKDYVSLSHAAPEFGPRKLYANLRRAASQDDDSVVTLIFCIGWLTRIELSELLAPAALFIAAVYAVYSLSSWPPDVRSTPMSGPPYAPAQLRRWANS